MASAARLHATGIGDPSGALMPDERPLVSVRRHVMCLAAVVLETLGFIAIAIMVSYLFEYSKVVRTLTGLLLLAAVVRLFWAVLEYFMERFVITDRRLLLCAGVLNRNVAIMPMTRVTDFTFHKSFAGRLLHYATFRVESAGQDQALGSVAFLPHSDELYQILMGILFNAPRAEAPVLDEEDELEEVPAELLVQPVAHGRAPGAAPYPDFSDAPTGPIARVMVNDALMYPAYDDGDLDGDGTGTPDGAAPTPVPRRAEVTEEAPENPIHQRPTSRWIRRSR